MGVEKSAITLYWEQSRGQDRRQRESNHKEKAVGRVEKLYDALDEMAEEYRRLLIREFEKEGYSFFLYKKCMADDKGRTDNIGGGRGALETENEMLDMEKRIRQLCEKLNEPLPLPIQVLEEFISAHQALKDKKTIKPWHVEDYEGEYRHLKRRMVEKLVESKK